MILSLYNSAPPQQTVYLDVRDLSRSKSWIFAQAIASRIERVAQILATRCLATLLRYCRFFLITFASLSCQVLFSYDEHDDVVLNQLKEFNKKTLMSAENYLTKADPKDSSEAETVEGRVLLILLGSPLNLLLSA